MKTKRYDVINYLIKKYHYNTYLEIGTRDNSNYDKINIKHKESIDPNPKTTVTYKMTSDDAFKIIKDNKKKYDIIFIDGLHVAEQVNRDIENSLYCLNDNGVIVLHDCNPISAKHVVPYEVYLKKRGNWNGSVWQSIVNLRVNRDDLQVYVVDTDWGCGIVKRGSQLLYKDGTVTDNDLYSYKYLENHRNELLNLISVEKFKELF